ncbi:MRNIP-like protein, partial [Mya arenaria]
MARRGYRRYFLVSLNCANVLHLQQPYVRSRDLHIRGHWRKILGGTRYREIAAPTFTTTADFGDLDLAQGYVDYFGKLYPVPVEFNKHWGELCGAGCILSNANDMAEWMKFHLRGWKTLWHTGTTFGYRAILSLFPDQDFGVLTAFTGDYPSFMFRTNLNMYTADLMLGVDPWLNASTICTFPEPWKSSVKSSSSPPRNEAYGNIEIYKYKSENVLMGRYGFALVALYPKSIADYFYAEGREFIKHSEDFSVFKFVSKSETLQLQQYQPAHRPNPGYPSGDLQSRSQSPPYLGKGLKNIMPQEFQVVQCYSCSTFQVHQVKKALKWACKMCGEKQSIKKVFGRGTGAECRQHVQKLNTRRGDLDTIKQTVTLASDRRQLQRCNMFQLRWAKTEERRFTKYGKNGAGSKENDSKYPIFSTNQDASKPRSVIGQPASDCDSS